MLTLSGWKDSSSPMWGMKDGRTRALGNCYATGRVLEQNTCQSGPISRRNIGESVCGVVKVTIGYYRNVVIWHSICIESASR